jgi:hypothetical protein
MHLSGRLYYGGLGKIRYVNYEKHIPYAFNRALGYGHYLRGYEFYVIDGQSMLLNKNSFRYQLVKQRYYKIPFGNAFRAFNTIPFSLYANTYFDVGYVNESIYQKTNSLSNSWQFGYGLGLDIITYYDFIIRLEYSRNKLNEHGFYLHFTSGF